MKNIQQKNGITLIALIITIIVLLILAGITIGALTSNNSVLKQAGSAKNSTEVAREKEIVHISAMSAIASDNEGGLLELELQKALDSNTGIGKTKVTDDDGTFIIEFVESGRCYELDGKGEAEEFETHTDETPGKLAGTGTEADPFKIESIEDLVAFAIMVNSGDSSLGLASNVFSGKYVALIRNLDFNSKFSYVDYTTTIYGDLNTDGIVEDIKTELTKRDTGCIGFRGIGKGDNHQFKGVFDGKDHIVKNVYIHRFVDGEYSGFFRECEGTIQNFKLSGDIISDTWNAGGINGHTATTGEGQVDIINCTNYANVTGRNMVAGITCRAKKNIISCKNYGRINLLSYEAHPYSSSGGIVGYCSDNITIKDCTNYGEIVGDRAGGIVGCLHTAKIDGCVNYGKAKGGIIYRTYGNSTLNIVNCCNYGNCTSGIFHYYNGSSASVNVVLNMYNCCNLGKATSGAVGSIGDTCTSIKLNMNNFYNAGTVSKAIIGSKGTKAEVNISNTYYDSNSSTAVGAVSAGVTSKTTSEIKSQNFVNTLNSNIGDNTEWKEWELGKEGLPVLKGLNY